MIFAVVGKIGYGKTAYMTYRLMQRINKGQRVYSNYRINHPMAQPLDLNHINEIFKLESTAIAIDEAGQFFDARRSGSKVNLLLSYILNQSRKRRVDIFLAEQRFDDLDVRARLNYQIYATVKPYKLCNGKLRRATVDEIYDANVDYIGFHEYDTDGLPYRIGLVNMRKVAKLYDSFYYYDIESTVAGSDKPKRKGTAARYIEKETGIEVEE